jgi:serine/threonine-protein kinase
MRACPACGAALPAGASFCPACGAAADPSDTPTVASPGTPAGGRPDPPAPSAVPPASAAYAAGTLLAGRYRLVGLLGRGGMGEVYRADDLTLGQSVALKFLPPSLASDADRLRRFYQEARVAREIAHPNVCRVYDVGATDGRAFLSMEYVDGEDLASLLRRIGRLPGEKGVEIARQLCAGLAAIHERGVVHRDLKPGNVMLDGRGRVRLTDFGLAALGAEVVGAEARAGTPAYMAPEQLRGERVDARSDVFALGLVLYEIFTGKRAFEGDTPAEIARRHRDSAPRSPSTILTDLDPAIERVIARCLEQDPAARPSSPLAVAAALPGGDPLAAALAAGEVPSIEMVAAAGARGTLRPWVGVACFLAVVAGIGVAAVPGAPARLHAWDPMEKSPEVLEDRAREVLTRLGHVEPAEDTQTGFRENGEVLDWIAKTDSSASRWDRLRHARPPAVVFWYRQSPGQLIPLSTELRWDDPPNTLAGMARLELDTRGRLVSLDVVPPERGGWGDTTSVGPGIDSRPEWTALFDAAGLDRASLHATPVEWSPPGYVDVCEAWRGFAPEDSSSEIVVQAGAYRGRPTHFAIHGPWSVTAEVVRRVETTSDRIVEGALVIGIFGILVGGVFAAIRNVRLGRGDRVGARRVAIAMILLTILGWVLVTNHVPGPQEEINLFLKFMGPALLIGAMVWAFYLALEPYVRRTWPRRIIGWSRVVTGRLRDPLVGRDVLAGGVLFLVRQGLETAKILVSGARGAPPPRPSLGFPECLLGTSDAVAAALAGVLNAVFQSMFLLLLLLLLRVVLRDGRVASIVYVALYAALGAFGAPAGQRWIGAALEGVAGLAALVVFVRFGLLAHLAGQLFSILASWFPLTLDSSRWYAGSSTFAVVLVLALGAYGLWSAVRREPPARARA